MIQALELTSFLFCCGAVVCYLTAGLLFWREKRPIGAVLALAGWLGNLGIFALNWYVNGYPPFASMYQVLSVLSLVFPILLSLLVGRRRERFWMAPFFLVGAAIPLIGTLFMDRQMHWSLMPALRSVWFVPHVFSYMISYALCTIAFLFTLISLFHRSGRVRAEEGVYAVLRLAFPFMVFGLLLGAVWADQVWGNYWQWDIKEVWALITCLFYLCYFHARRTDGLKRWNTVFTTLGFLSLIVTFLCVNLLPAMPGSLHIYTS